MATTTVSAPTRPYSEHISRVLLVAFLLSAAHTIYVTIAGIADPGFSATTPAAWAFYAVGFGLVAAARNERRAAQIVVLTVLTVLILVAVFAYPSVFTGKMQNTFGWLENDVYTGLLMIAGYLGVLRLRGTTLVR